MERKRKNMRNQALQCNQLLRPIMRMYSCKTNTHTHVSVELSHIKSKWIQVHAHLCVPSVSSPSPAPQRGRYSERCRWSWAPVAAAAGSGWPGWRRRRWMLGKGNGPAALGLAWGGLPLPCCCRPSWWPGPPRAAPAGSPHGNILSRATRDTHIHSIKLMRVLIQSNTLRRIFWVLNKYKLNRQHLWFNFGYHKY